MRLRAIAFCNNVAVIGRTQLPLVPNKLRRCRISTEPCRNPNVVEELLEPQMSQFGSKRRRFFERNRMQRLKQPAQVATATWMKTVIAQGTDFEV